MYDRGCQFAQLRQFNQIGADTLLANHFYHIYIEFRKQIKKGYLYKAQKTSSHEKITKTPAFYNAAPVPPLGVRGM